MLTRLFLLGRRLARLSFNTLRRWVELLPVLKPPKATIKGNRHKPIPWLYSSFGAFWGMLQLRLSPIYQRLAVQEIQNVLSYAEDALHPLPWQWLNRLPRLIRLYLAFWYTVLAACMRMLSLSRTARQDYYALNRQGAFVSHGVPMVEACWNPLQNTLASPILIVPGLNTPPAFFREMVAYFQEKGYPTYVAQLPQNGLAALEEAAQSLAGQLQQVCHHHADKPVHVIGHCLGGLLTKQVLETMPQFDAVKSLVSLGTGFLGADGVSVLRDYWMERHPQEVVPSIFNQLIDSEASHVSQKLTGVMLHSILTVWDYIVPVRKGILAFSEAYNYERQRHQDASLKGHISHTIWEDWKVDHLTLALSPKVFSHIEAQLNRCFEAEAPPHALPA